MEHAERISQNLQRKKMTEEIEGDESLKKYDSHSDSYRSPTMC
jgi:hypothetical protein